MSRYTLLKKAVNDVIDSNTDNAYRARMNGNTNKYDLAYADKMDASSVALKAEMALLEEDMDDE